MRHVVNDRDDGDPSYRVRQATGVICIQLGCDLDEATGRLTILAAAIGESLDDAALDVLDGILRFDLN